MLRAFGSELAATNMAEPPLGWDVVVLSSAGAFCPVCAAVRALMSSRKRGRSTDTGAVARTPKRAR
jgi:hypothetical protein